ncbi:TRAP transporter substrate-binding protein DctP [Pseudomonas putida]|uniref:TRAP transporter substrate-binding protein n=1 Tax=Pseudomonas putida TaxID=303 RepID=UPI00300EF852
MLFRSKTQSIPRVPARPSADQPRPVQQRPSPLQCATVLTLASLCSAFPVAAEEQINLKFTHRFSTKHYAWTHGGQVFTEAVTHASGGKVTFENYPAAQLGKDYFSLLRSGLADVAVFIPAYESDKLPMSTVAELPGMYSNICQGARTLGSMVSDTGTIGKSEYNRHGLHVLFVTLMPPYTFMTSKQPTASLAAMDGLKIRGAGAAMTKTVQALDAVPVQISASEVYEALSRGTIDGAVYPYNALTPYALEDQLKYSVDGVSLGGTAVVYAINSKKWNALPTSVKTIMSQAAQSTQASMCQWLDEENVRIKNQIVRDNGHIVTQLPAEDLAKLTFAMQQVKESWAQVMDAARHDGSALLEEYHQLFVASEQ